VPQLKLITIKNQNAFDDKDKNGKLFPGISI
jgi:hypothetical protein